MKKFKKMMAFALAMVMVLAMALPAMAADEPATAPTKGSITVNSPVVGATYKVYKIFDMTTNAAVDAFSYTINENSPFYTAVKSYAEAKDPEATGDDADKPINGLTLSKIEGSDPVTYNVSADETVFDAQKFGKAMQAVLTDSITPDATKVCETSTEDTSDFIKLDNLALGYFLINPTYPEVAAVTVTLDDTTSFTNDDLVKNADGTVKEPRELTDDAKTKINTYATTTVDDAYVNKYIEDHGITTNKDGSPLNDTGKGEYKTDLINKLKADAEEKVLAAFNNNASEADHNVKEPILVFLDSSQPDAVINEKNEIDKWDIPVNPTADTEPGTPDHGEPEGGKNIIVQEATATTPAYSADWSEAEIGESVHYQLRVNAMNFIRADLTDDNKDNETINQVKQYFLADYQSGHMHFDETKGLHVSVWQGDNKNNSQGDGTNGTIANVTKNPDGSLNTDGYLDYTDKKDVFFKNTTQTDGQASNFDTENNSIFGSGTGIMVPWVFVKENPTDTELAELTEQFPIYTITNIPKTNGNDPVYKIEARKNEGTEQAPVYVPVKKVDENGDWIPDGNGGYENEPDQWVSVNNHIVNSQGYVYDTDENGNLKKVDGQYVFVQDTTPVYTFSIYNSDVTIVVDYWMILDDDAIVDEPGNKNFAQFGWSPIDNTDSEGNPKTPENPKDTDKPDQKEKVDEATVYTFALAWVKVDEQAKALADATFKLPFYVKVDETTGKPVKDGNAYVFAFALKDEDGKYVEVTDETYPDDKSKAPGADGVYPKFTKDNTTNLITTDIKGVVTIKGVEQGVYSITETEAPAGYNKLTKPFNVEAKKSGPSVTTKTKTTIYLDANGNITDTVTTATEEYDTDADSFNNDNATDPEETSVPVYQFDPIENKQGTELPSTGGIGTTIFYVVGAILVIGAGVVLITRRRMDG